MKKRYAPRAAGFASAFPAVTIPAVTFLDFSPLAVAPPLLATPWAALAARNLEMLGASASVINHRLTRLAFAGPNPSARDRREFHRMGQEKLEAAAESWTAMTLRTMSSGPQIGMQVFQYWLRTMQSYAGLAARPPATYAAAHTAWLGAAMQGSSTLARQNMDALATLAQHGLKPVHRRATANARRLAKA